MYVSPFIDRTLPVLNSMYRTAIDAGEALGASFSPRRLVRHGNCMYLANSLAQFTASAGIGGVKLSCVKRITIKKWIYQYSLESRRLSADQTKHRCLPLGKYVVYLDYFLFRDL
jgi:hypothetical protein